MKPIVFEFPNAKSIVVSGDIHGDFTQLVYKCCIQYAMTDTLIIVAGDCGFGFEKPGYYENIYKRCRERLSSLNYGTNYPCLNKFQTGIFNFSNENIFISPSA